MLYSEFPETPSEIYSSETVIRYLTSKQDYQVEANGEKAVALKAFYPVLEDDPSNQAQKHVIGLSVTRRLELTPSQVVELGNHVVEKKHASAASNGRTSNAALAGWACLNAALVLNESLTFEKDEGTPDDPNPHHANILGWPTPVPRKEKDQKELLRIVGVLWQSSHEVEFI